MTYIASRLRTNSVIYEGRALSRAVAFGERASTFGFEEIAWNAM